MVFHVTNYMRETNVWRIRKGRWILWGFVASVPIYRNTYWDYLGRRAAVRNYIYSLMGWNEKELIKYADEKRADWGYRTRYEPFYDFSLKKRKYEAQTPEESIADTPRLRTVSNRPAQEGQYHGRDVRMMVAIAKEHNRVPGSFDYNYEQDFYSLYPEIEHEFYATVGNPKKSRGLNFNHKL